MNINTNLSSFVKKHKNKKNQIIFHKANCKNKKIIDNLINNFYIKKIALSLNPQKKEELEVDIQLLAVTQIKYGF